MEFARLVVDALGTLIWPVILALVFFKLLPEIRKRLEAGGFTLKIGGSELTVQEANQQLTKQIEDLSNRVNALADAHESLGPQAVNIKFFERGIELPPIATEPESITPSPFPHKILWVDDEPKNNAFETATLQRRGVEVISVRSTSEAESTLHARGDIEVVVTDMHRIESGVERPRAGLELAELLRKQEPTLPIVLYCGPRSLAEYADEIPTLFTAATVSPSRLQADLRLERLVVLEVRRLLATAGIAVEHGDNARFDLTATVAGHRLLIETQVGSSRLSRPKDVIDSFPEAFESDPLAKVWVVFFRLENTYTISSIGENVQVMHLSAVPTVLRGLIKESGA